MMRVPVMRPILAGRVVGLGLGRVAWAGAGVGLLAGGVLAGPEGAKVRHGEASLTRRGDTTVIRASDRAIIDYRSFDIARHETVRFVQPSADARVLNRIQGSDPTRIDGTLTANGRVYIVNPAGVYFGDGALVNVGSIYAAAANLSNADFLNNVDRFTGARGEVINRGTITAHRVALVGRRVTNAGLIVAPEGSVALTAGEDVLIGEENGHVFAKFSGGAKADAAAAPGVVNLGEVHAAGGEVLFGAGDAFAVAIDLPGAVRAASIRAQAGAGAVTVSGALDASASTPGERGGRVELLAENVGIFSAAIDASGPAGGGTILIGGDFQGRGQTPTASKTIVSEGSTLRADATADGHGGRIIVWADGWTAYHGSLSARGAGSGDGGFAEVSGKEHLLFRGQADLSAPRGDAGRLLLDPKNIVIANGGGGALTNITFAANFDGTETFDADAITALTNVGTHVTLQASNDITVNEAIITSANGSGGDLTLQAGRSIAINADIFTDNGTLTLSANETLANGVVNGQRDGDLPAVLAIGPTRVVNTGAGAASLTLSTGAGLTNSNSSSLFLAGTLIGGAVSLAENGPDDGGATLGSGSQLFGVSVAIQSEGSVNLDGTIVAGGLSVHAGTDGVGDAAINGAIFTNGPVTILAESSVTNAGGTIDSGGGDVSISANHNVTLRNLTTGGGNLTVFADLDASGLGSFLQANTTSSRTFGGDILVSTVNAILNGSLNAGAGRLRVQPSAVSGTMGLAGGAGSLQLESIELQSRLLTTSSLTLGRDNGTGAVDCRPVGFTTSTPFDLTIRGGAISTGTLFLGTAGTPSLSFIANAATVTVSAGSVLAVPDGGRINFQADEVVLSPTALLLAGAGGQVSFVPTTGRTVGVGGGAGGFSISATEASRVRAGTLSIGSLDSGRMTVGSVSPDSTVTTLRLLSGSDIVESAANTAPDVTLAGRLILEAQTAIGEAGASGELDAAVNEVAASLLGSGSIRLRLTGSATRVAAATPDGAVEVTAGSGDLILGQVAAGNGGSITITTEAGGLFDDTLPGTRVVTTGTAFLSAATSIGQNGGPGGSGTSMDLDVGLAVASASGSIAIRLIDPDAGGVVVGVDSSVAGDIGISSDPGAGTVTIAGLDANAGSITVDTNNAPLVVAGAVTADSGPGTTGTGAITINDSGAVTITAPVTTDRGEIVLSGTGDVLLSGAAAAVRVQDGAGGVTITADDEPDGVGAFAINNAAGLVRTAGGSIAITSADIALSGTIDAGTGVVTLQPSTDTRTVDLGAAAPAQFSLSNAEAGLITAGTLVVGRLTSTTGITVGLADLSSGATNLSLRTGGSILEEAANNTTDLRVNGALSLIAVGGIGGPSALDALDVHVGGEFSAITLSGDVNVRSPANLTVGTVSAGTRNVTLTTTGALIDGNGAALNVVGQDITLLAFGAIGAALDPLDLAAGRVFAQSTVAGGVSLHQAGAVTLTSVVAASGDVSIVVDGGSASINEVRAGGGGNISLSVLAGGLAEAGGGDPAADLVANGLTLFAAGAIGLLNPIETDIDTLVSSRSSGGLFLDDLGSLTLADVRDATGSISVAAAGALSIDTVEALLGNVSLTAATGSLSAIDGDPEDDVCGVNVLLTAAGSIGGGPFALTICDDACITVAAGGDVTLNSAGDMLVESISGGAVTLTAAGSILECVGDGGSPEITATTATLAAGGDIRGEAPGTAMEIDVGTLTATAGGAITLRGVGAGLTLASAATTGGAIDISTASGDLRVNFASAAGGASPLRLAADAGSISEFSPDPAADLIGNAVSLSARNGIGSANALEIDAATLNAALSGPAGDIRLTESTDVTLLSVLAPGAVLIDAGGALTANSVLGGTVGLSAASLSVPGRVQAGGAATLSAGTITVKGGVSGGASVTLRGAGIAVGGIGVGAGASITSPGNITFESTRTVTLQEPVSAGGSLTVRDAAVANLNADQSAANSLLLANIGLVNLGHSVDLAAGAGGVSAATGVGAINLTGTGGVNRVSTTSAGDVALAHVTAGSAAGLTVESSGSAVLAGVNLPDQSGGALTITIDSDAAGARSLTAGTLLARSVSLSGSSTALPDDTLTLTGAVRSGRSITIRDAADVRFALDAAATAEGGDISILSGVGRITLFGGGGTNTFTAGGGGSVSLAPVVSDTGASLRVVAAGGATLRGVDLDRAAGTDGSLYVAIDPADNTPGARLMIGSVAARQIELRAGQTRDDHIVLNGATTSTLGPVVVTRADTLSVNRTVDSAAGITFSNIGSVNVRPGASLTARAGNLSLFSGVGRVFLTAGGDSTTFSAGGDADALLARIESAPGATGVLSILAQGSVQLAAANLSGPLSIVADSDGDSAATLAAGPLRAARITLSGGPGPTADDTLALNGPVTTLAGPVLIQRAGAVAINADVVSAHGLTVRDAAAVALSQDVALRAAAGNVSLFLNVGGLTLAGSGVTTVAASHDVTLAPLSSAAGSLDITAARDVTLSPVDLNLGDLTLCFDGDGSGDGVLTLSSVTSVRSLHVGCGTGGAPSSAAAILTGDITSSGNVEFDAPVTLGTGSVTIASTGGDVLFAGPIDSADALTGRSLSIISRRTTFAGPVGAAAAPSDLSIAHADTLAIAAGILIRGDFRANGPGPAHLGADVFAGGLVHFAGPLSLTADSTLRADAGGIRLDGPIDGASRLVLAGQSAIATLGADVGAAVPLLSLVVNANLRFGGSTIAADSVTFNGDIDAIAPAQSLTLDAPAGIRLRARLGSRQPGFDAIRAEGPLTIGGATPASITSLGSQTYTHPIRLAGHTALRAGGDIRLGSTVDGAFNLTTASDGGSVRLAGDLGRSTPIAGAVFNAPVVIENDLAISAAGVHFRGAIDAARPGLGLSLSTTGIGVFLDGDVGAGGSLHPLASLDVTGAASLGSAGSPVTVRTSGAQVWRGDVSLGSDTTFVTTATSSTTAHDLIAFLDDVTDGDGAAAITIHNPASTRFSGRVNASRLATDAPGQTVIAGPVVSTTGSQTFADAVRVESAIVAFSGAAITFSQSLAGSNATAPAVTITDSQTTAFRGPVGGLAASPDALGSLRIDGDGTALVSGGSIRTIGTQVYANAIEFSTATTLTASEVRFGASIGSTPSPAPAGALADLTIAAPTVVLSPSSAVPLALGSLVIDGAAEISRSLTTSGRQVYSGPVLVADEVVLTSTAAADVTFNGDVSGPGRLSVTTAGLTRFSRDVSVREVIADGGGSTEIHDALVQTAGAQTWLDHVLLPQSTTFAAGSGADVRLLGGLSPLAGAEGIDVRVALPGPASTANLSGGFSAASFAFDAPVVIATDASISATKSIAFLGTLDGGASAPAASLTLHVAETPVPGNLQPITEPIPTIRFTGDVGASTPLGSLRLGDPDAPRQAPPAVASIVAGPTSLSDSNADYALIINVDGPFTMGPNEKFTVLGSLNLTAREAEVGDLTALVAIRVAADQIRIVGRESGAIGTVTAGQLQAFVGGESSERADNSGTDFVAGDSIDFEGVVSRIGAGVDSNIRFATNTGEGIRGVDTFIRTRVDPPVEPSTLVFTAGTAPIVLDVKAGSAPNNVASSLAGALPREQRILDVPQDAVTVLSVANELQEIGILLDRIGVSAIESALGRALYEDLRMPPTARRHPNEPRAVVLAAAEEVYYKPSRLSGRAALDMRDTIRELFLYKDERAQLSVVRRAIADAWLDWLDSPGADPRVPGAFGAFLQSNDPDGQAARCIRALALLFEQIDGLGLTGFERSQVRRFVVKKISPDRVSPEAFEFAAFTNGLDDATAAGAAAD